MLIEAVEQASEQPDKLRFHDLWYYSHVPLPINPDRFAMKFSRKRAMTFFISIVTSGLRFWATGRKDCPTVGLVCLWFVHNAALNVFRPAGTAIASVEK